MYCDQLALVLLAAFCFGAASVLAEDRANFYVNCDGNVEIEAPAGGGVEIGKMLVKMDGTIESDQMQLIADALASMQGSIEGLKTGLANATATIQVLADEAGVLKADNVVLKADNAALKADNVVLKADTAALKVDKAAMA
eukprot:gene23777-30253_t